MNLIEKLGGFEKAKKYLAWMEMEGLLMGSYQIENGRASFYDFTLRSALADHDRTDHCTDIRNHISPNTKVIEHEQKPKQEVKHGFYDSNCW